MMSLVNYESWTTATIRIMNLIKKKYMRMRNLKVAFHTCDRTRRDMNFTVFCIF